MDYKKKKVKISHQLCAAVSSCEPTHVHLFADLAFSLFKSNTDAENAKPCFKVMEES